MIRKKATRAAMLSALFLVAAGPLGVIAPRFAKGEGVPPGFTKVSAIVSHADVDGSGHVTSVTLTPGPERPKVQPWAEWATSALGETVYLAGSQSSAQTENAGVVGSVNANEAVIHFDHPDKLTVSAPVGASMTVWHK